MVCAHAPELEAEERKQQRQRNDDAYDERGTPIRHKQEHDDRNEQDALKQVVQHGILAIGHQYVAVVKVTICTSPGNTSVLSSWIFSFTNSNTWDGFSPLRITTMPSTTSSLPSNPTCPTRGVELSMTRATWRTNTGFRQLFHDDVLDVFFGLQQTDTAHHVRLSVFSITSPPTFMLLFSTAW